MVTSYESYEQLQAIAQLAASAVFVAVIVGVAFYAFRPANKKAFEHAAQLPLEISNPNEKR